jgi:hypothetical protein
LTAAAFEAVASAATLARAEDDAVVDEALANDDGMGFAAV